MFFQYFPGNYPWSSAFNLALMAGGTLGDVHRSLGPCRDAEPDGDAWAKAWEEAAEQQERLGPRRPGRGLEPERRSTAAESVRLSPERRAPDPAWRAEDGELLEVAGCLHESDRLRGNCHSHVLMSTPRMGFSPYTSSPQKATTRGHPWSSSMADSTSPRSSSTASSRTPLPSVAWRVWSRIPQESVSRCGCGECPRGPDYEVPTAAIIDALERDAMTSTRRALASSASAWVGTTPPARTTTFEPRVKAVAAWGAIWDWGATWEKRWATRSPNGPSRASTG